VNPLKTLSGNDRSEEPDSLYQLYTMHGLRDGKHVYAGTVTRSDRDRRRAKNRVAKKSRKRNRG